MPVCPSSCIFCQPGAVLDVRSTSSGTTPFEFSSEFTGLASSTVRLRNLQVMHQSAVKSTTTTFPSEMDLASFSSEYVFQSTDENVSPYTNTTIRPASAAESNGTTPRAIGRLVIRNVR